MLQRLFLLCLAVSFLNTSGCEECDFGFTRDNGPDLIVDWPQDDTVIAVGDPFFVSATFPTMSEEIAHAGEITEGGGLIVTRLFKLEAGSDTVTNALEAFEITGEEGEVLPPGTSRDPSVAVLRFTCTDGRCSFRQRLRPLQKGSYIVAVEGSVLDLVTDSFNDVCGQPSFRSSQLAGVSNVADFDIANVLTRADGGFYYDQIRTNLNDLFVITVE